MASNLSSKSDIYNFMTSQELLTRLKAIIYDELWDYNKNYDPRYGQFLTENYQNFTLFEILILSEKLRMNIPITTIINRCENSFNEKESFLNYIKDFMIQQPNQETNNLLSFIFVIISNLYDSVNSLTKCITKLLEEQKNSKKQTESLQRELAATNSKTGFMTSFYINKLHEYGESPMYIACKEGLSEIVKYLCEVGNADPEATDEDGQTALHHACENGSLPIVQYLCEVQKVRQKEDNCGQTPLHIACEKGYLPIIKYLCEVHKVNPEIKSNWGYTPLYIACRDGHLPIVQYLCEVKKVNPETKDKDGLTPLHISCYEGHLHIVKYLCEIQKVNKEAKSKYGKTPLYYACFKDNNLLTVKYLCEVQKVCAETIYFEGNCLNSPLHNAVFHSCLSIVKYLCEIQKVEPKARNENGTTPYEIASQYDKRPIIGYFESIGIKE